SRDDRVSALEFEQVDAFDVQSLAILIYSDDDREPYRRFRRRDHNYEKHKHQAVQLIVRAGKSDERQVHRVEHQFNRHKQGNDVALEHKSHNAQPEQNRAQHQIIGNRNDVHWSSLLASTSAPRIAIKIKIEVASKGKTYWLKSIRDISSVETELVVA